MENNLYRIYSYTETSRANPEENEDSHYSAISVKGDFIILLVCDGLGGAPGGQTASHALRDEIKNTISETVMAEMAGLKSTELIKTKLSGIFSDVLQRTRTLLMQEFLAENEKRKEKGMPLLPEKHKRGGFSTTFSCGIIIRNILYYCWVGDSRIYYIRNGRLHLLTFDHSDGVAKENFNELEELFAGKVMSKCISPFADEEFVEITESEIFDFDIQSGDVIFAASDGIFDYLLPWTLEMVLVKNLAFGYPIKEYIHKIFYQIRPVFQDDTTVAAAFSGMVKPFGNKYHYIEDGFYYLNELNLNEKIEYEFQRFPLSWDDIDKTSHWELYKNRKPWSEILSGEVRLTGKQILPQKRVCKKCMNVFSFTDNAPEHCPEANCNGEWYNGGFLEIYKKNSTDFSNPYKIYTLLLNKSGKGNLYVITSEGVYDTQNYNHFDFSGIGSDIVIKSIDNVWEIEQRQNDENDLYVFYPEIFLSEKKSFTQMKKIIIGNEIFRFEYPFKDKKNQFYFYNDSFGLDKKTVYVFGQTGKVKPEMTIKDKSVKFINLPGNYIDELTGMITYNETEPCIAVQEFKKDNALFFLTGEKLLQYQHFPENVIIRSNDYFLAFRSSTNSKTGV